MENVLGGIGNTPLVELRKVVPLLEGKSIQTFLEDEFIGIIATQNVAVRLVHMLV